MSANTNISDDLRRQLEVMAGPGKSADDLANEAVVLYLRKRQQDKDWLNLKAFGHENGKQSDYTEADVVDLVTQTRLGR